MGSSSIISSLEAEAESQRWRPQATAWGPASRRESGWTTQGSSGGCPAGLPGKVRQVGHFSAAASPPTKADLPNSLPGKGGRFPLGRRGTTTHSWFPRPHPKPPALPPRATCPPHAVLTGPLSVTLPPTEPEAKGQRVGREWNCHVQSPRGLAWPAPGPESAVAWRVLLHREPSPPAPRHCELLAEARGH